MRGVETGKTIAVIEAPERVLPWQTRLVGRVVDEVIDLHHRERTPIALLQGKFEPALAAVSSSLVGVKHPGHDLPPRGEGVQRLHPPFYPRRILRKGRVVDDKMAWNGIDP